MSSLFDKNYAGKLVFYHEIWVSPRLSLWPVRTDLTNNSSIAQSFTPPRNSKNTRNFDLLVLRMPLTFSLQRSLPNSGWCQPLGDTFQVFLEGPTVFQLVKPTLCQTANQRTSAPSACCEWSRLSQDQGAWPGSGIPGTGGRCEGFRMGQNLKPLGPEMLDYLMLTQNYVMLHLICHRASQLLILIPVWKMTATYSIEVLPTGSTSYSTRIPSASIMCGCLDVWVGSLITLTSWEDWNSKTKMTICASEPTCWLIRKYAIFTCT